MGRARAKRNERGCEQAQSEGTEGTAMPRGKAWALDGEASRVIAPKMEMLL